MYAQRLAVGHQAARASLQAMIDFIKQQLHEVERELRTHLERHHATLSELLRVVLVSSNEEDVPFDVRHVRVIYYQLTDPSGAKS